MTAPAPAPAASKERAQTTYLILREVPAGQTGAPTAIVYEPVETGIAANSAEHALKLWAEKAKAGEKGGMYVAIPNRSFKPTKITFSQTTVVKLG